MSDQPDFLLPKLTSLMMELFNALIMIKFYSSKFIPDINSSERNVEIMNEIMSIRTFMPPIANGKTSLRAPFFFASLFQEALSSQARGT